MPCGRRVVAGEHSEGGDQHGNRQMVPAFVLKGPLFTTLHSYYMLNIAHTVIITMFNLRL
jgi:hypothetical protein